MNLAEIKIWLEENKDNDEVKTFVDGLNSVTLDKVKSLAKDNKEIKSWLDSEKDKHSTKSLETWKTNNLNTLIDEEIKKRFPEADPKDTELAKLKAEIEKMQKESLRKDLTNKAIKTMTDKGLDISLVDYFIGDSEESTMKNLEKVESVFGAIIEKQVAERLKNNSYTPPAGNGNTAITKEKFQSMGYSERMKIYNENPELYKELSN